MHDELGNHRVVVHGNLAPFVHTGIDAHTERARGVRLKHGLLRRAKLNQSSRAGQEIAEGVFGVDTTLNRPAVALHIRLLDCQRLSRSNTDHDLNQIKARDRFRYWVLHLQAGIHFKEIKTLILTNHKLNGTRALVADCLG